jgi:kynurenine 3-monooxygenase
MIAIVGGGLAGSLLAILLAKKGHYVDVFERRPDLRQGEVGGGRSINLALSHRGLRGLARAGLVEQVLKEAVPMPGRQVHPLHGQEFYSPYGKNPDYYINSISRGGLNRILLQAASEYRQIRFFFNSRCNEVLLDQMAVDITDTTTQERKTFTGYELILGSDGADSAVRHTLEKLIPEMQSKVEWLSHGYKELSMPPKANGDFRLVKNALHIWPRSTYMLIALPNFDASYTCTLFFPMQGQPSFETLQTAEEIQAFFEEQFPDVLQEIPDLVEQFMTNPVGKLGTLRCDTWHYQDKIALLGDAAHAVVPFYGQGMNASFEDCLAFDDCLEEHGSNWAKILPQYVQMRQANSTAIANLAIENFYEMRDHVANPAFQLKRQLEVQLENQYPDYRSKYSLVTFSPEYPYTYAFEQGNKQDAFLMEFCSQNLNKTIELDHLYRALKAL